MKENHSTFIHDVPLPVGVRVLLIGVGLFAVIITPLELHRGIWPINLTTPFFAVIIIGAFGVGFSAISGGLFGNAMRWQITPGQIEIRLLNPFHQRHYIYKPAEIKSILIQKHEWSEGGATWAVEISAIDGVRFESISFDSTAKAEKLKEEINNVFLKNQIDKDDF